MPALPLLPALPDLPAYPTVLILSITLVVASIFVIRSRKAQAHANFTSPPGTRPTSKVAPALPPTYGATTVTINAPASVFKPCSTTRINVEEVRTPSIGDTDSETTACTYGSSVHDVDADKAPSAGSTYRSAVDPKIIVAHTETYVDDISFSFRSQEPAISPQQPVDNPTELGISPKRPAKNTMLTLNAHAPVFRPRMSISTVTSDVDDVARAEALRTRADEIYNAGKNEVQKLNEEASRLIFEAKNKSSKPGWVDLHGLYATEAVEYAGKGLETARKAGVWQVKFVVGRGLHSPDHAAKVKPRVLEEMYRLGLRSEVDPNNDGIVVVRLRR